MCVPVFLCLFNLGGALGTYLQINCTNLMPGKLSIAYAAVVIVFNINKKSSGVDGRAQGLPQSHYKNPPVKRSITITIRGRNKGLYSVWEPPPHSTTLFYSPRILSALLLPIHLTKKSVSVCLDVCVSMIYSTFGQVNNLQNNAMYSEENNLRSAYSIK